MTASKTLITTLIALAAGSTLAAGSPWTTPVGEADATVAPAAVSTRARNAVQAETLQALQRHQVLVGQASQTEPATTTSLVYASARSRAEVKAEVLAARANGTLPTAGDATEPSHPAANRVASPRTLATLQR